MHIYLKLNTFAKKKINNLFYQEQKFQKKCVYLI